MRRIVILLFSFGMIIALAACGQSAASEKQEQIQSAVQKTEEQVKDLYAVLLAVIHDFLYLVHIGEILGKVGCLELCWIMRLEPSRLVAYPCVACSM